MANVFEWVTSNMNYRVKLILLDILMPNELVCKTVSVYVSSLWSQWLLIHIQATEKLINQVQNMKNIQLYLYSRTL